MSITDFQNVILASPNGLASVLAITVKARRLTYRTCDDHAAHAVEILATRRGLKVLRTQTDDGMHVIGLTGFSKGGAR